MRKRDPIVWVQPEGSTLVDRRTLGFLTQRPQGTIRAHCPVNTYHSDGRALYDLDRAAKVLEVVPSRGHSCVPLDL